MNKLLMALTAGLFVATATPAFAEEEKKEAPEEMKKKPKKEMPAELKAKIDEIKKKVKAGELTKEQAKEARMAAVKEFKKKKKEKK